MRRSLSSVGHIRPWLAVLLWLVASTAASGGQATTTRDAPPRDKTATARLSGRVFAADTGRPLRGAIVQVMPAKSRNLNERGWWVPTDAQGRWTLGDLEQGGFTVRAAKGGYLTLQYGQKRPFEPGKTITLGAGQSFDAADFVLPRAGAISGTVTDESGDPVTGALVRAIRYQYVDGRRQLTAGGAGIEVILQGGLTDDLGRYRIHGLTPGEYYVCAVFSPSGESVSRFGYLPTYYPGTAAASEARRVSLVTRHEAPDVSFNLSHARHANVSGTVVGSAGVPIGATVTLRAADGNDLVPLQMVNAASGTFTIPTVPPGDYRVHVHTGEVKGGSGVMEFATVPLSVDGQDVSGLVIATAPGANASGRVVFEETSGPAKGLYVRTLPMTPGAPEHLSAFARVNPDFTFEARGLTGRQKFEVSTLPEGWFLKSVTHEGKDVTDQGIEFAAGQNLSGVQILLSQTATTLSGTVENSADNAARPVADYTVVAFSPDSTKWGYRTRFVRSMRPDQEGRFTLRGLPPGEYVVAAIDYVEPGQEHDPERLSAWSALGKKVTLGDGEASTVTLKLVR